MIPARSMARFAGNSQQRAGRPVAIDDTGVGHRLEPGCVALQAAGRDWALEVGSSILVPRAVRPPRPPPVGDGELVQLITHPVEIRLSLPQAGHVGNTLGDD